MGVGSARSGEKAVCVRACVHSECELWWACPAGSGGRAEGPPPPPRALGRADSPRLSDPALQTGSEELPGVCRDTMTLCVAPGLVVSCAPAGKERGKGQGAPGPVLDLPLRLLCREEEE